MSSDYPYFCFFFFFHATPTTEIYTLSLHDALPISHPAGPMLVDRMVLAPDALAAYFDIAPGLPRDTSMSDRKSTRLNSSHMSISYAVFCLKKKNHAALP